jgi:hypothetical protein
MTHSTTRRGSLEYLSEGYIIHWDERGLLVEVTSYHARPLLIVWKDVLSLAKLAGHGPASQESPAPSKRAGKRKPTRRSTPEV